MLPACSRFPRNRLEKPCGNRPALAHLLGVNWIYPKGVFCGACYDSCDRRRTKNTMRLAKKHVRFALSVIVLSGLGHSAQAVAARQKMDFSDLDSVERTSVEARVDARIAKELGALYPNLPNLLAEDMASQQGPETQEKILTILEQVLKASRTGSPEHRAEWLLAADCLAGHLMFAGHANSPEKARLRQRLATDGFEFSYFELDGGWYYTHNLLWQVWKDYGQTDWGEWAFVLLLENGWYAGHACRNGSDEVRPVIRHGEGFLAARPRSRLRLQVMFLVAQAYETWWSIGLLPECKTGKEPGCEQEEDEEVDPSKFRDGAPMAREKAIAYYKRVLRLAPESPEGQDARERLPLLESGKDTDQRRFYCVYD